MPLTKQRLFKFMLTDYLWLLWIIIPLLLLATYKLWFRLLGILFIPEDKIGMVTKKFVLFGEKKELPPNRIIAIEGEAGYQAQTLAPGIHFWYWIWQYEVTLQPLTIIPPGQLGLIIAKDGQDLPTNAILARKVDCDAFQDAAAFIKNGGQKGRQTAYIASGVYRINRFLFDIELTPMKKIGENMVGIVTTLDGEPVEAGNIAGKEVVGHDNFQDADAFLRAGGNKGLQPQVILSGSYNLNPWFVSVEEIEMTIIPIGHVGVIISFYGREGEDLSGEDFRHGNIVAKGQKGVWADPLGPGKYPVNRFLYRVETVPTTNLVLNWASARTESHMLDKHLSTITVRSRDGFPFNLDVSQIIHIPATEAPKVIARFGNMNNLVSQVLEPTIGNYFRNSAQGSDVISFLSSRRERQESAKEHIGKVLEEYNVHGVDTLIGDIVPPESLMKTLTDRKLAEEQKITFETQREAQETRQRLEKETAIADMQKEMVAANQGVEIAERVADAAVKKAAGEASGVKIAATADAEKVKLSAAAEAERLRLIAEADADKIKLLSNAEAEKIEVIGKAEADKTLALGKASAEAYRLAVEAMGGDNFTRLKVIESIGKEGVKIIPEIIISGGADGNNGPISGLLGLQLLEQLNERKKDTTPPSE